MQLEPSAQNESSLIWNRAGARAVRNVAKIVQRCVILRPVGASVPGARSGWRRIHSHVPVHELIEDVDNTKPSWESHGKT